MTESLATSPAAARYSRISTLMKLAVFVAPFVVGACGFLAGRSSALRLALPCEVMVVVTVFALDRATRAFQGDQRPTAITDFLGVLWFVSAYLFAFGAGFTL